jgi:hypothetical protein
MQTKLLTHPNEQGGTILLQDGTKVYWLEGRDNEAVIRHPNGRFESVSTDETHPIIAACDRVWLAGAEQKRKMSRAELREWERAWQSR